MTLFSLEIPKEASGVIEGIVVSDTGNVHIRWRQPMAIEITADGMELFMTSLAAGALDVHATGSCVATSDG